MRAPRWTRRLRGAGREGVFLFAAVVVWLALVALGVALGALFGAL